MSDDRFQRCDRRLCFRQATMSVAEDGMLWTRCDRHGKLEWLERIAADSYQRLYGDRRQETLAMLARTLPESAAADDSDPVALVTEVRPRVRPSGLAEHA